MAPKQLTWDDAREKRLLLAIIHFTPQSTPPWAKIAKSVGEGASEEACKKKLRRLKDAAQTQFGEMGDDAGDGEDGVEKPKTPAKGRGKKATGGSTTKSTGKRKAKKDVSEEVADDQNDEESPVKKVKTEIKEASQDDSDDGLL